MGKREEDKLNVQIDLEVLRIFRVQCAERGIKQKEGAEAAIKAWLGLPPPAMEEPDVRLRRAMEGLRALYALPGAEPRALFAALETGLKAFGVSPQSSRRRKAETE